MEWLLWLTGIFLVVPSLLYWLGDNKESFKSPRAVLRFLAAKGLTLWGAIACLLVVSWLILSLLTYKPQGGADFDDTPTDIWDYAR